MMHQMSLLKCHLCPDAFQKYGALVKHCAATHSAKPSVTCCQRQFPKVQLADHMRYHLDPSAFHCTPCQKDFLSGHLLSRHESTKHQLGHSAYQCTVCQHKFRAPNLLRIHMTKHTDARARPQFPCPTCDKVFAYESSLRGHVQRHHTQTLTEMCETCGKGFASKWLLTAHQKSHEVKTLEQCDECWKYFAHLPSHKQKVHGERGVVQCVECGKSISATYYRLHLRQYHGERKELPCEVCGKVFLNQKNYKVHMGLHQGVKYECRFCGDTFNILGNRTKHEKARHLKEYLRLKEAQEEEKQRPPGDTVEILMMPEEEDGEDTVVVGEVDGVVG